jgi:uridylate kinase
MMGKGKYGAGNSHVFDPLGAEIVKRCRIPILVVDGRDIDDMRNAILGQRIKGTVIDG